jgi:nicotinate-nucleotide adenylyltransferase
MGAVPIALLGGTFDPVHNAHLAIARRALEVLGAARVLWLPTGAPRYRKPAVASARHRVAMLRLALAGEPRWAIDERELAPGASGYTLDTLRALRAELGAQTPLVMLIGSDQFARLDTWHRWRELFEFARFAVFARGRGERMREPGAADVPAGGVIHVPFEPLAISASELRARIARGEDVAAFLPLPVLAYIREHGLYR